MEGHEGNLEAHTGDEEDEAEDAEQVDGHGGHLAEIERAGSAIQQGDAVEQEGGREEGEEDELGAGFCALGALLVVGDEGRHGDGGELKADEEHQEVAAGDHEVHAEEGEQGDGVELALLDTVLGGSEPLGRHEEDDDGADIEGGLEGGHHAGALVHTAEGRVDGLSVGADIAEDEDGLGQQEHYGKQGTHMAAAGAAAGFSAIGCSAGQGALFFTAGKKVGDEKHQHDGQQTHLFAHAQKLGIVDCHYSLFYKRLVNQRPATTCAVGRMCSTTGATPV